jgi:cytochrome c-type biogenesis protein CcmH
VTRRLAIVAALALALLAPSALPAAGATPQTSLSEISSEVMCPVCGTLLELAESPQAQRQKVFIERQVKAGKSKQEIKDALVAEYGQEVLALPRGSGFELSAYVVPIVAFAIAAIALAFGVAKWRRAGGGPGEGDGERPRGPSSADEERLDADLARYDL